MRLQNLLPVLLLPACIFSSAAPRDEAGPGLVELLARDDAGGLLGGLTDDLKALKSLLSPTSISNINSIISHAAYLLDDKTTEQVKGLIGHADQLLTDDFTEQLGNLVTPNFVSSIGGLIKNANDLLTPNFVNETSGLISAASPLISVVNDLLSAVAE